MARRGLTEEELDQFEELLPVMIEYADEIVEEALEETIEVLVYSEVRDSDEADDFVESIQVLRLGGKSRQIRFEPKNERVRTIERGIKPFSIKDKMLSSSKAKISKDGHRYRTVPLSREAARPPSTDKDRAVRDKINEVVRGSKFSLQFAGTNPETGRYEVRDKLKNLRRKRVFKDEAEYKQKKKPLSREYTIFRTMSSRPGTSEWFHPGSSGKNIVEQLDRWLLDNEEAIFEEAFDSIFETLFGS